MKKIISFFIALTLLLLLPFGVSAFKVEEGETVNLSQKEIINDDLYVFSNSADIKQEINGDLVIMSGEAKVQEKIHQDLFIASGQVNVSAEIGDDVKIAAGNVTISKNIGGDLLVTGGYVTVEEGATISGRVAISAGVVNIKGNVEEDLIATSGNLEISGNIKGNVYAEAERIIIKESATIENNLVYTSSQKAQIDNLSSIKGETQHTSIEKKSTNNASRFTSFFAKKSFTNKLVTNILKWIASALSLFLIGALVLFLRKDLPDLIYKNFKKQSLNTILFGLIVFCVIPVISLILLFTIIGTPLGLIGLILYFIGLYFSTVTAAILASKHFLPDLNPYLSLLLGILAISAILAILGFVPIIGSAIKLVLKLAIYSLNFGTIYFLVKKSSK